MSQFDSGTATAVHMMLAPFVARGRHHGKENADRSRLPGAYDLRFHRNHPAAELLDERPRRLDRQPDPARRMFASLRISRHDSGMPAGCAGLTSGLHGSRQAV